MMMNRRPKRQRAAAFEALEGRLTLSTGISVASPHLHAAVVRRAQVERKVPASFTGIVSTDGTTLNTNNLTGHIGPDHLAGYATGTQVGKQFEGGNVYLGNTQGTLVLQLSPLYTVKKGRSSTRTFGITVVSATGKYVPYLSSTGTITKWNVPDRPNATAHVTGVFTL